MKRPQPVPPLDTQSHLEPRLPSPPRWHVASLLALALGFESLFLVHGLGWFDEGWALYAARRLHEGGTLYHDTFFLFPPGHLLPAWLAYALAPPGIVLARLFYALFAVALVLSLHRLARRLMPAVFALLAASLVAVAAPESHLVHLLFGWRYLVFGVLGLLAFGRFLDSGKRRFLWLAGAWSGVMLTFRLSPAFGVACGIGIATLAASRDGRWLRDLGAYAAGLILAALPLLTWLALGPGFEKAWNEAVVRLMGLQSAQSLPFAPLVLPARWDRDGFEDLFVAVQLRAYPLLILGYLAALAVDWLRHRRREGPWSHTLLLAVVVWAGVYLLRIGGRSDDHHLYSALPPLCLLLAHLLSTGFAACEARLPRIRSLPGLATVLCLSAFAAWAFLMRSDQYLSLARRGRFPLQSVSQPLHLPTPGEARMVDHKVRLLRHWTRPEETILNLSLTPMLHLLSDRSGPGHLDVFMPGTFLSEAEELAFLAQLRQSPPAAVVFPVVAFDRMKSRSVRRTAPHITRWVEANYRSLEEPRNPFVVMVPNDARPANERSASSPIPGR